MQTDLLDLPPGSLPPERHRPQRHCRLGGAEWAALSADEVRPVHGSVYEDWLRPRHSAA